MNRSLVIQTSLAAQMDADAESDRLSSPELSGNPSRSLQPIDYAQRHAARSNHRQTQAQERIRRPHRRTPSALDRPLAHVSGRSSEPLRPLRKATTSGPDTDDSSSFDDKMLDEILREDTSLDSIGSKVSGSTNSNSQDSVCNASDLLVESLNWPNPGTIADHSF